MARGDIFRIVFPGAPSGSSGREQVGRRPAVVVEADISGTSLPTAMVIPMTGQLAALRFPHTLDITPSPENGLSQPSVALIFQLRAIDRKRMEKKLGELESAYMIQIEEEIRRMLGL